MNKMLNNGLKALVCGTAAVVITLLMGLSLIRSTAVVHQDSYTPAAWTAGLPVQVDHTQFG